MGIATAVSKFFKRQHTRREARSAALEFFRTSEGEKPHEGISKAIYFDANGVVVRVCYGHKKPPSRMWFRVSELGISKLSFSDVEKYGERQWKR